MLRLAIPQNLNSGIWNRLSRHPINSSKQSAPDSKRIAAKAHGSSRSAPSSGASAARFRTELAANASIVNVVSKIKRIQVFLNRSALLALAQVEAKKKAQLHSWAPIFFAVKQLTSCRPCRPCRPYRACRLEHHRRLLWPAYLQPSLLL